MCGYGMYEDRLRGMALERDESKSGGCGRSGPLNCAGNAAIRHRWRRLEADGKRTYTLAALPCMNTAATLLLLRACQRHARVTINIDTYTATAI